MTGSATETPAACPRSTVDPFSDEFLADPFPYLAELRDAGPVVYLDRYGVYAIARHEQVQAVLKEPRVFSSAAGTGITNIAGREPVAQAEHSARGRSPVHTRNRKVVARALAPRSLAYLQEIFDRSAEELAASLVSRGSFDAVPDLAEVFPARVFPDASGITEDGRDQLLACGAMVFNGQCPRNHLIHNVRVGHIGGSARPGPRQHSQSVVGMLIGPCRSVVTKSRCRHRHIGRSLTPAARPRPRHRSCGTHGSSGRSLLVAPAR